MIENQIDKSELLIYRAAVLRGAIESVRPPIRKIYYDESKSITTREIVINIKSKIIERKISKTVDKIRSCGSRPTRVNVAIVSGISRKTVSKYHHLL